MNSEAFLSTDCSNLYTHSYSTAVLQHSRPTAQPSYNTNHPTAQPSYSTAVLQHSRPTTPTILQHSHPTTQPSYSTAVLQHSRPTTQPSYNTSRPTAQLSYNTAVLQHQSSYNTNCPTTPAVLQEPSTVRLKSVF